MPEGKSISILEAFVGIPRGIDKSRWDASSIIARWLVATRARVLMMTVFSTFFMGWLATHIYLHTDVHERPLREQLTTFAIVFTAFFFEHATNNLLNDYVDFKRGIDNENYFRARYGSHPMQFLSDAGMLTYMIVTGSIGLVCDVYLIYQYGEFVPVFVGIKWFFLLMYTYPLKPYGLGEIAIFLAWGPLLIVGGTYVVVGRHDFYENETMWGTGLLLSLENGLTITAVILGKHTDKIREDPAKGVYTLPVLLGGQQARFLTIFVLCAQYLAAFQMLWKYNVGGLFFLPLALPKLLPAVEALFYPAPREAPEKQKGYPKGAWPLYYVFFTFRHTHAYMQWRFLGLVFQTVWSLYSDQLDPALSNLLVASLTIGVGVFAVIKIGKHFTTTIEDEKPVASTPKPQKPKNKRLNGLKRQSDRPSTMPR